MTDQLHKTIQVVAVCATALIVIFKLFGKQEVVQQPVAKTEVVTIPGKRDTIVIHNNTVVYPASGVAVAQGAGITALQVDSLLREYFAKVSYDTTFSDSSSKEHLSIEIERNRLKRIIRSLDVYQLTKTVTIAIPPKNEFYAGLFTMPTPVKPIFGPMLSFHDQRGFILSAGKDLNSSGIYGSFQIKLGK